MKLLENLLGKEFEHCLIIDGIQDGVLICENCNEAFASGDADPLCPECRELEDSLEN